MSKENTYENEVEENTMLEFEKMVTSALIRSSINVTEIEDPMSRDSIQASHKHLFKARDSNDIVPLITYSLDSISKKPDSISKKPHDNQENLSEDSNLSSLSKSSTTTSFDTDTPDFPPVIVLCDLIEEDISVKTKSVSLPRGSKIMYYKPTMNFLKTQSDEGFLIVSDKKESYNEVKSGAYENAMNILYKYKSDSYSTSPNKDLDNWECSTLETYQVSEFLDSDNSGETPVVQDRSVQNVTLSFVLKTPVTVSQTGIVPLKQEIMRDETVNKEENVDNLNLFKINKNIMKESNFYESRAIESKAMSKVISSEKAGNRLPSPESSIVQKDSIMNNFIESLFGDLTKSFRSDDNIVLTKIIPSDKVMSETVNLETSKDKLIKGIMTKTLMKKIQPLLKPKVQECSFDRRASINKKKDVRNDKEIITVVSYKQEVINGRKVKPRTSSTIADLVLLLRNESSPISAYKIWWTNLVSNGDVIIIRQNVIINVNDIVDSIAKTIILRDLGVLILPERILISNAIADVKLKSKKLKILLNRNYPLLSAKIKTNSIGNIIFDRQISKETDIETDMPNILLNINSLLKRSTRTSQSTVSIKEKSNVRELFWKFKSKKSDKEEFKRHLDTLKKYINVRPIVYQ